MFIAHNQVRMHDTDMAGILYFASQFRFAHDALEDFVAHLGFSLPSLFHGNSFVFVIRHVSVRYLSRSAVSRNRDDDTCNA
jgi:1,4-dihydroxy-2-naphthoyl-CoA hydrolase